MRAIILILGGIGFLCLYWGYLASRDTSRSDSSYVVPGVAGVVILGIDAVLVIVYALYRLLFT